VWWLWVLVPLASIGFLSFAPPLFFGLRYGRRFGYLWSVVFLGLIVGFFIVDPDTSGHSVRDGVSTALLMADWLGGAAVAGGYVLTTRRGDDPVSFARAQRKRRKLARAIVAKDPRLAVEANIGRPDVPGERHDGGLVDVNRVSAESLAAVPGVGPGLAARIVDTRKEVGGYDSLDDLIGTLNLNPRDLDDASDRLLFIPL
jgi:hypothetical protein